ncbi:MAG TPA: hypothetical protein VJQ82_00395 [Terriglobales bacterium]|nr:hypothetical protein [Terriglobales bacterium]
MIATRVKGRESWRHDEVWRLYGENKEVADALKVGSLVKIDHEGVGEITRIGQLNKEMPPYAEIDYDHGEARWAVFLHQCQSLTAEELVAHQKEIDSLIDRICNHARCGSGDSTYWRCTIKELKQIAAILDAATERTGEAAKGGGGA